MTMAPLNLNRVFLLTIYKTAVLGNCETYQCSPLSLVQRIIVLLALVLYGRRTGDFHARKGSIIGAIGAIRLLV